MSVVKSTSPTAVRSGAKRTGTAGRPSKKAGVATAAGYAKSRGATAAAHLGERYMAKPATVTVTFHSSAFKHASDNTQKKREFVRGAVSGIVTTDVRGGAKEGFRQERTHAKDEKVREGAAQR